MLAPARRPPSVPASVHDVREALLAMNNGEYPFRLVQDSDTELHLEWDVVDASWYERFASIKLTTTYRARLLIYAAEHEVRFHEMLRSSSLWLGFDGWRPRFNFDFEYLSGVTAIVWTGAAYGITRGWPPRIGEIYRFELDTVWAKREIERFVNETGWAFRPVTAGFEATAGGAAWGDRLSLGLIRRWGRRRFWGLVYLISWIGILGSTVTQVPADRQNMLAMAIVFGSIAAIHVAIMGIWLLVRWLSARQSRSDELAVDAAAHGPLAGEGTEGSG